MKKIVLSLLLVTVSLVAFSQKGTIEYLEKNPKYGDIVLGDSIVGNLRKLSLLEDKGNGNFQTKAVDVKADIYKAGDISPWAVFVEVESFIINDIIVYFELTDAIEVLRYATEMYGEKTAAGEDATFYWFGKNVSATVGVDGSKGIYMILSRN